ncbi:AAA-like domain-containing protein [Fischerella sp. PCC 9605]|uniref:AAA-like domain-containing protein n=1 Tax=Fischerella sp. PCC 9605 TaxID=1173024 RepID=UPI00047B22FF|nr:AAA-like domain-containing protein [Fischerella sp. PCC 9605]
MEHQKSKRIRGVILTAAGLKRLQAAIESAEIQEKNGERFTQEELSERMKVSTKTISRLWSLTTGLDQRTLKFCFGAFNLDLRKEDYTCSDKSNDLNKSFEYIHALENQETVDIYSSEDYIVESERQTQKLIKNSTCYQPLAAVLKYPSGPVPLDSIYYIPRPPIEELAYREITQPGCVIHIKAPKEMGKTSLMFRVLARSKALGYRIVSLDINQVDVAILSNLDKFLRWLCKSASVQLNLEPNLDEYWDRETGSKVSCSLYFKNYLLESVETPVVLALNEVNRIFKCPELAQEFLSLLRSWHEEAQQEETWQKLRLVVTYSTESYIPLNLYQSPCNIGLPLQLPEFTHSQVEELAERHGLNWRQNNEAEQLMAMVGGHPALIRIALYYLCRQEVTLSELLQQAATEVGIYRTHLRRLLANLQENPILTEALEVLLSSESSIFLEPVVAHQLESMGLVKFHMDGITISRELYRIYFSKHLYNGRLRAIHSCNSTYKTFISSSS